MVQTRHGTQKKSNKTPVKTIKKEQPNNVVRKKLQNNLDRCKNWIQQQKKEKIKSIQPEDLNSNESDDERRDINLAAIPVKHILSNEETLNSITTTKQKHEKCEFNLKTTFACTGYIRKWRKCETNCIILL